MRARRRETVLLACICMCGLRHVASISSHPADVPFNLQADEAESLRAAQRDLRQAGPGPSGPGNQPAAAAADSTRHEITAFIGILTGYQDTEVGETDEYVQRRMAIRETWFWPEERRGIVMKFVVGRQPDEARERQLAVESSEHGDMLQIDADDCYSCLPQKMLAFFLHVSRTHAARWIVKMDDDVYFSPSRLLLAAQQWGAMRADYVGCMKHGDVISQPSNKWFEPNHLLLGRNYPMNAYGSTYALSGWVADQVIAPNAHMLRLLNNEDTTMGLWMNAFKINFWEDMRLCHPQCHSAAVGVANTACSGLCKPVSDMYTAHSTLACFIEYEAPSLPYLPSYPAHKAFEQLRVTL